MLLLRLVRCSRRRPSFHDFTCWTKASAPRRRRINAMAIYKAGRFSADNEVLAYTQILPEQPSPLPTVLSLHGAGAAVRQRVFYLADALADLGLGTFSFDFSGHGESSGNL